MTDEMHSVALVAAAGEGSRLGLGEKAFLSLDHSTFLERVVDALYSCVDRMLVGVPPGKVEQATRLVGSRADVLEGGRTRQATILSLLERSDEELVVIQDVARPFVSPELVLRVMDAGRRWRAAGAVLLVNTPAVKVQDGVVAGFVQPPAGLMQTPQAYRRDLLVRAYVHAEATGLKAPSTSQLVDAIGERIRAVPGDEANFKVTTSYDWLVATRIASVLESPQR
jgi:2-C-methyl-D-erythritol 4-phosphate cytidylyltransferase